MRKEPFKVNEQDFQLLQKIKNLKNKGRTEEYILKLNRSKEIYK